MTFSGDRIENPAPRLFPTLDGIKKRYNYLHLYLSFLLIAIIKTETEVSEIKSIFPNLKPVTL